MAKMSDELAAAVEAYDRARCAWAWKRYASGNSQEENYQRSRLPPEQREHIAPMIKAAIDAYLGAMRPPAGPPPAAIFVRFGEFESHITLRSWNVEAFPGALEYRRA